MRALCMCLVLLLSSCASVDQWAKAAFTPSPYEGIYSMDENGFPIPIMVPYTGINFDHEFEEPRPCQCHSRHGEIIGLDDLRRSVTTSCQLRSH
jgi:hypothetical protein